MKSFGKSIDLLITILAIIVVPLAARIIMVMISPFGKSFDPDDVFLPVTIHHIALLVLTILLMKLYSKSNLAQWGFNLNEFKLTMKIFGWYGLIYLIPIFLYDVLPSLISGDPPSLDYSLNVQNISGVLGFQFLLSGTCEEPLFRGFAMTILSLSWKGYYRIGKVEISTAGLWATLFFMLAHINISFKPFGITHFSVWQQIWALGLGLFYAIIFHKTKSFFGPVLMHGYANGIIFVILYIMVFLMT